ncbi:MAG: GNAT family acetyltransferase [Anaerolineales bacterium]
MTVVIRTFRFPDDYEAVYTLWSNAGPGIQLRRSDTPEEIAKKVQRDPDLFLLAEQQGELVGAVMGGFDGRRGLVYHLAVRADCRGQGIGSLLMDELETRLRKKGCLKVYLLVTRDNGGVISFYEKRGWEIMDLTLMGKTIA